MKYFLLILALFLPKFLSAHVLQENGPFYEFENVYFNPNKELLAFPTDKTHAMRSFLWHPMRISPDQTRRKKDLLSKKVHKWDGTTLLLADSSSGFLTHYFHFLEHLLGIWQFGGAQAAEQVRHIIFCSQENTLRPLSWKGVNHINEKIIKALFPKAKVHTLYDLRKHKKKSIFCQKMILSSRIQSYHLPLCTSINKMLGASWKDLSQPSMESLRQTILSSLQVTTLPAAEKLRITYVKRHPPRALTPELEEALIQSIETKTGIPVHRVDFAAISFEDQLRIVANTDVLIGVHGNGLSHIVFLPPSATVFELFPSTGFTWDYALLSKIRNLDYYGHTVNGWVTSEEDPHTSSFHCFGNLNHVVDEVDIDSIVEIIRKKS